MANEKKNDKKAASAEPTSEGNGEHGNGSNGNGNGSTALAPVSPTAPAAVKFALPIPTEADMNARVVEAQGKLTALQTLSQDETLPEPVRNAVVELFKQANPEKPGMEEVITTWTVTRISIAQPTTQSAAKPDSAKQGDLYTSAGTVLEKPFPFIPLWFNEENIMFKQGEKAPECSSPDAKLGRPYGICEQCPHLPFGKQNGGRGDQKRTECSNQIVVALLAVDLSAVYIFQFSKTSRGAGNALIALAKAHPVPWTQSYLLSTEKKTGDLGVYFVAKVEPTGKKNDEHTMRVAKALSELYGANRKRNLGDFYLKAASSARTAVAAEQEFQGDALDSALGVEPDLSPGPAPAAARSAAKPM